MSNLEIKQNSLLFCNPKLAKEYDNEKNSIPLSAICAQSAKKYGGFALAADTILLFENKQFIII